MKGKEGDDREEGRTPAWMNRHRFFHGSCIVRGSNTLYPYFLHLSFVVQSSGYGHRVTGLRTIIAPLEYDIIVLA